MQYDPIKKSLGTFFNKSIILRKLFYTLLDLLLLRTWHVKNSLKRVKRRMPAKAFVLDAGSGFGQYTWLMSSRYRNWSIKGVDIKQEQIDDCTSFFARTGRSERVKFETADLTTLRTPDTFNLILSVDVMEHIEDDDTVFRNMYDSLSNGGILIISTPSDKGGSDVHGENEESFIEEHVRDGYNIDNIRKKLEKAGFTKINTRYTYGFPGHLSWLLSMKYPVKMLNLSYGFFLLLPLYYLVVLPICVPNIVPEQDY
jgi:SAM-dependent methyltransferase